MILQPQDLQDILALATEMGLELPSKAYVIGAILFSIVGMVAWWYGRKMQRTRVKWLGVVLCFYGYVAAETWVLYAVGVGLCVALYVWRDQ